MVSLGDLVKITGGGTPSRKVLEYWDGNIPWATVKDFKSLQLNSTLENISPEGLKKSASNLIPKGTIIVPTRMAVGKAAINTISLAINQDLKALHIINKSEVDRNYLFRALLNSSEHLVRRSKGATVKGITLDVLKELKIPLPPLKEQKRIAAILDKADAIRRKRHQAIDLTDQLLRSIFLDMFGDPVTNPKGFELRNLEEFYINKKEGTKCGPFGSALKKDEYCDTGIPVWNMDNISKSGKFVPPSKLWINKEKYLQLKTYNTINGDIIISRAGTVGKMCVLNTNHEHSIISTNLIRLRLNNNLSPLFFVSLMNYCKGRVGRLKTGPDGTFTHMNTGILNKLSFPYPPLELQKKYEKVQNETKEQLHKQLRRLELTDNLFYSLTQQAFKGELDKQTEAA